MKTICTTLCTLGFIAGATILAINNHWMMGSIFIFAAVSCSLNLKQDEHDNRPKN